MPNPHSLLGKKAFVTGGKRRIGRGIALAFAEAGADVGINDLHDDDDAQHTLQLIRDMGREAELFTADISDSAQVETMFKAFLERFLTIAHERGCARAEWSVLDWNTPAIKFYERLGATVMPDWRIARMDL